MNTWIKVAAVASLLGASGITFAACGGDPTGSGDPSGTGIKGSSPGADGGPLCGSANEACCEGVCHGVGLVCIQNVCTVQQRTPSH